MRTLKAFLRQPVACIATGLVLAVILACVFASVVAPYDPLKQDLRAANALPSAQHWLGADTLGRDILSRLLHGGQTTLAGALIAVSVFLILGVPLGLMAGYRRGWLDALVSRIVEIMFAIPVMIIVLVVVSVFSGGIAASMITIGILAFGSLFRVVRGQTMAAAGELYVKAARSEGLRPTAILRRHILPNIWGPVIVQVSLFAAGAILTESGLAFLGFSVQPPTPSWGAMIGEAARVISAHPWQLIPPGVLIGLLVMCLGLIGDGVRDAVTRAVSPDKTGGRSAVAVSTDLATNLGRDGALLSVRGLTVAVDRPGGSVVVVDDVSFDILPGECVGIVGESGSGKSITAKALIGLLPRGGRILAGQAIFDGQDLAALSRAAIAKVRGARIGYVPQEPMTTLDPVFTIGSQLAEVVRRHRHGQDGGHGQGDGQNQERGQGHGRRRASRTQTQARVIELLELVGLDRQIVKRYPHELSGGQAQRVGIALALAGEPALLIADEPTTALDVTVQAQILDLLRHLQSQLGMAIILITHDWGVLADLAEQATVLYAGQVVEAADVVTLFHQPVHPYTQALIAANPAGAQRGEPLASIPGQVPDPAALPPGCHFAPRCSLARPDCLQPVQLVWHDQAKASRCLLDRADLEVSA